MAQVIGAVGYTGTLYVLANTVQQKEWDGEFSPANKAWAKTVDLRPTRTALAETATWTLWWTFTPAGRPVLSQARQDYLRLQPLTPEDIHAEAGRLLQELRVQDPPNSPTAPTTWPTFRRIFLARRNPGP